MKGAVLSAEDISDIFREAIEVFGWFQPLSSNERAKGKGLGCQATKAARSGPSDLALGPQR